MIKDRLDNFKNYHLSHPLWEKAFRYLRDSDFSQLPLGRYEIEGKDLYAILQRNPLLAWDARSWEAHRDYIDIQYVVSGPEIIGHAALPALRRSAPYDAAKDFQAFEEGPGSALRVESGEFVVLYPEDAHRPNVAVPGANAEEVTVVVVKLRVAAVE